MSRQILRVFDRSACLKSSVLPPRRFFSFAAVPDSSHFGVLKNRVAIVTGGSSGIGHAIAQLFALEGASVAVLSRQMERATAAAKIIEDKAKAQLGKQVRVLAVQCDVSNSRSVAEAVENVARQLGSPSILVNSAGINYNSLLVQASDEKIAAVLNTNLLGSIYTSRAVIKHMLKSKTGDILNIGSVVGTSGNAGQSVYAASKAGLVGFTKSLAQELGSKKIRVNAIVPGYVDSPMTSELAENVREAVRLRIPLGSFGSPQDVAGVALFLCSPAAQYVTGQAIGVDGGLAAAR